MFCGTSSYSSLPSTLKLVHDFVYVYDGDSPSARLLVTLVGETTGYVVNRTHTNLFVRFMSDYRIGYRGFSATFTALPQGK